MSTSIEKFARIPELLSCLGKVISNKRLLYDLCQTSKSFNTAFIPCLYEEVYFVASNARVLIDHLDVLLQCKSLKHIKGFDFAISSREVRLAERSSSSDFHNEAMQSLLAATPGLLSFSWRDQPLSMNTLTAVHQHCPKLESLRISHPSEEELGIPYEGDVVREDEFINLYDLHGDLVSRRGELVETLLRSPALKTLGLSIDPDAIHRLNHNDLSLDYWDFLWNLINDYRAAGGKPLKIRKLKLGSGIVLIKEDHEQEHEPAYYLKHLIDLNCLVDVLVSNESHEGLLFQGGFDTIAWWTFSPSVCPNLRTFGFCDSTELLEEWAKELEPGYLSQIKMTDDSVGIFEIGKKLQGNVNKAAPSMLSVVEAEQPEYGDFSLLMLPNLQAVSIGLWPIEADVRDAFLDWIEAMTSLDQLFFRQVCFSPIRDRTYYEELAHEIALRNPKLRYLKFDNGFAWRIWHGLQTGDKGSCHLEELDRFEQREIDAFQEGETHMSQYMMSKTLK